MPVHPPNTTRLREVEAGLGALAKELERLLGFPPANLHWWREELRDVIFELEKTRTPKAS